jgi:scyllo-inositol 2-dehydrogenase (NADP+)
MRPIPSAILSFGLSGKVFHAPFLDANPAFELHAVLERNRNEAEASYPGIKTYREIDALLADPNIELVVVNTPNATHYEYTRLALEAGKHVLVEKPFVTSVAEGEELAKLAAAKGLQLAVYHNRRFDSDFRTVQRVLHEGTLGEIREAAIHFDRFRPALSPKVHKEEPGPGAGILFDLGSHVIDAALHLFGMPEELFADIRLQRPGTQVDDAFELLLFYPQMRVRLHGGYFLRETLPAFQLFGTEGSFLKSRADVQEPDLLAGKRPGGDGWGIEPNQEMGWIHDPSGRRQVPTEQGNYMLFFNQLFDAIREGKQLPVSASEGLDTIRIIEGAHLSSGARRALNPRDLAR